MFAVCTRLKPHPEITMIILVYLLQIIMYTQIIVFLPVNQSKPEEEMFCFRIQIRLCLIICMFCEEVSDLDDWLGAFYSDTCAFLFCYSKETELRGRYVGGWRLIEL